MTMIGQTDGLAQNAIRNDRTVVNLICTCEEPRVCEWRHGLRRTEEGEVVSMQFCEKCSLEIRNGKES